ncbi:hypothetical protein CYMTET_36505 [Cymbomonas tetramitiformis]|uniref:Uncharacterized protein n=1 Tax=Cymbomonas tetramitiformis TaxID=36881 RepID=A0AAE0CFX4_9CHLO|nr:hypothetical protein CYMTET_36505 [Cymbomonas tetramitiformis]
MRNRKSIRRSPVRRRIRLLEWLLPVLVLFLYGGFFLIPTSEKSRTGQLIETVYRSAADAQVGAVPHGGVAWGDRQALPADTGTATTAGREPSALTDAIETEEPTRRSAGDAASLERGQLKVGAHVRVVQRLAHRVMAASSANLDVA